MGIAIIWVLIYHFHLYTPVLKEISSVGYCGVDIFLFLSGFGLFYSIYKSEKFNLKKYYIRRLLRIFPTYILIGIGLSIFTFHDSLFVCLWKCTTLGFWTNTPFYEWYIPSLLFCYLIFPWCYKLLMKNEKYYFVLLACAILFPVPFMIIDKCGVWQYHLIYRLPIFFWGTFVAKKTVNETIDWGKYYFYTAILFLFLGVLMWTILKGHFIQYGLSFSTPALTIFVIPIIKIFDKILSKIGKISLEIYLCHMFFLKPVRGGILLDVPVDNLGTLYLCVTSIILAVLLKTLITKITMFINIYYGYNK